MSVRLRILPAADTDLDEAALYIARDSEERAIRLYDAADATYRLLLEHPNRGPLHEFDHPRLRDIRRCSLVGFRNHLVFYRVEGDVVEVLRILHGARDIPAVLIDFLDSDRE